MKSINYSPERKFSPRSGDRSRSPARSRCDNPKSNHNNSSRSPSAASTDESTLPISRGGSHSAIMEDISSRIIRLKSNGGLIVCTAPFEEILNLLTKALTDHDVLISKFPSMESFQDDLRKDINKLRIAFQSVTAQVPEDATPLNTSASGFSPADCPTHQESYGLRRRSLEPIQRRNADILDNATNLSLVNSLRDVRSTVRRLEQHRDEALAHSMDLDLSVKLLNDDLSITKQQLGASASITELNVLQQSLLAKYAKIETHLSEYKTSLSEEVHQKIQRYLSDFSASINTLEGIFRQQQDKMESRISSCSKEYDMKLFRDSIESDIASIVRKTSFLDDAAKAQGHALIELQQKNSVAMFHRYYSNWKRNVLKSGIMRWKEVIEWKRKYEDDKNSQKRVIKKILTGIMSRKKSLGFVKWVQYRDLHRKTESLKLKALALMCGRIDISLSATMSTAIKKWRRVIFLEKLNCRHHHDHVDDDDRLNNPIIEKPGSENITQQAQREISYNMNAIVGSFQSDTYGAVCVLAQEIQNIKSNDIAFLRKDWITQNQTMISSFNSTINEVIQRLDADCKSFQHAISERVDIVVAEFPSIHSDVKELTNLFKSHKSHLKNFEESNGRRLDTLFDQTGGLEKRLAYVEEMCNNMSRQVSSMMDEQSKSNVALTRLGELVANNETRRDEDRNAMNELMDHYGDELLKIKVTLGHTQVKCAALERELSSTNQELTHSQETSQSEHERVLDHLNSPGLQQPGLDRIVSVGHAYENLAKEKSYVTGINVKTTMVSASRLAMKSHGDKSKREEQVDVPAEIAAFAHDYALWISYQADHEALLRLIAGSNPDDQIYAEDDTIERRKSLLDVLKSNLSTDLERVAHSGTLDLADAKMRGSGLRWEARSIFIARVLDATKAALSKYDQILLPLPTRLGRTGPSVGVPVCVACDRPMRRHQSQSQK